VHGLSRWHSTTTSDNLAAVRSKVHIHEADLMDLSSVLTTMERSSRTPFSSGRARERPGVIHHTARCSRQ